MTKNSKLCLIIPSLRIGGMEHVMIKLASYFDCVAQYEVHLIVLMKGFDQYRLPKNVIIHYPKNSKKNKFIYQIKLIFHLRKLLLHLSPDAILSFGEMYNSFVLISVLFTNLKVFISDRSRPNKNWGIFHNFLRKNLYSNAYGIICQTSFSREFLLSYTRNNNILVIPNPVIIPSKFTTKDKNKRVVLSVGRLIKSKNIHLLIDIFDQIYNTNWELWIVGDGEEFNFLRKYSSTFQSSKRIIFHGSQKDLSSYYLNADIFAFTSESEGFPNAILEAMSYSLPIISYDCIAGPSDLIKDNFNGFLIPMNNKMLFKNKLEYLMVNESTRKQFGDKSYEFSKNYDINKIGNLYLQFLFNEKKDI